MPSDRDSHLSSEGAQSSRESSGVHNVRQGGIEEHGIRIDLTKIYKGVLRRLWFPLLCGILSAMLFGFIARYFAGQYTATTYLLLEEQVEGLPEKGYPITHLTSSSATQMISLPSNLAAVRGLLGLDLDDDEMEKMVVVEPPARDSNLIGVSATNRSPQVAVDVANGLSALVVKNSQDFLRRQLKVAYDYYRMQAQELQRKLAQKVRDLAELKGASGAYVIGEGGDLTVRGLENTEQELSRAQGSYDSLLVQYESLRREADKYPETLASGLGSGGLLQQRLSEISLALLQAKARYASENPQIKVLEAEREELQRLIAEGAEHDPFAPEESEILGVPHPIRQQIELQLLTLQGQLRSAQKQKEYLRGELEEKEERLALLPQKSMEVAEVYGERTRLEEQLYQAESQMRAAEALMKVGKGDLAVYQNAQEAEPAESLLLDLLPLIGFILGAGGGLSLTALYEAIDPKFRTATEVAQQFHPPCIATIPEYHLFSKTTAPERLLYPVRQIEEYIDRVEEKGSTPIISLTSSQKGEGKSAIVRALWDYYRDRDRKVAWCEFDPVANSFAPEEEENFSLAQYLHGDLPLEQLVEGEGSVYLRTKRDPKIREQLKERLPELVSALKSHFDVVLFDVPGVLEEAYAVNLLRATDIRLFVIGSSKVTKEYVHMAMKELDFQGIALSGIILSRALRAYLQDVRIKEESRRSRMQVVSSWAHGMKRKWKRKLASSA